LNWSLIYPPHPYLVNPDIRAPLGLLYIASVLEDLGEQVSIDNFTGTPFYSLCIKEADVYGITCTSIDIRMVEDLAKLIKTKYPNSKVIVGGVGTTIIEMFYGDDIDCFVVGEAELAMASIRQLILNNTLPKIIYGGNILNIDSIPFPARHLYSNALPLNIITSRGCYNSCSFCSSPFMYNHKVRFRSIDNIYAELNFLKKTYNTDYFIFEDDMVTAKKSRLLELCNRIKDLNIRWRAMIRVKPLDSEMMSAMKDAGCEEVAVGVESFDNNVLKMLNKGTTVKDNVRALKLIEQAGIKCRLLMMIRTPGQTEETLKLNKLFLQTVPYDTIACTVFTPIPLSDIWMNPDKYNIEILDKDTNNYNYSFFDASGIRRIKSIFKIKNRNLEELNSETEEFQRWLVDYTTVNKGVK